MYINSPRKGSRRSVAGKLGLNRIPELPIDDRRELVLQQSYRAEFGIAAEEAAIFALALDDDKLAVPRLITERRHAARAMSGVGTEKTVD
jgi:hypothetical protein